MTFFYDKPLNINTGINMPQKTSPALSAGAGRYAVFAYNTPVNSFVEKKAMPLEASENQIQELAMNNPRIMQIINENKLWEY